MIFPVGSDLARFVVRGGEVAIFCEVCEEVIGYPTYLNQAMTIWSAHTAEKSKQAREERADS